MLNEDFRNDLAELRLHRANLRVDCGAIMRGVVERAREAEGSSGVASTTATLTP